MKSFSLILILLASSVLVLPVYAQETGGSALDRIAEGAEAIYNATLGGIQWFWNVMSALWNGMGKAVDLISTTLTGVAQMFSSGWNLFISFWGNWGDPEAYRTMLTFKLMYPALEIQDYQTLQMIYWGIYYRNSELAPAGWANDTRTVSQITPAGALGFINFCIYGAGASMPIIMWVLQNFVLIHVAVIVGLLVWGMAAAVQRKSLDPIMENVERIYHIFKFYFNIVEWVVSRAIDLAQAVGQWLDTIIPF